mmetsp:Transcript_13912/g.29726  ORF Transcript_13912/g.29726 Transcript_13912/m.29726 type:complete len:446 (+) Transcript_13912:293-1630(+)
MVLRGPGGARACSHVGGAIHRAAQHLVLEDLVVGDDGGGEVVVHALARLQHQVQLPLRVLRHHLEGPEDLPRAQREVLGRQNPLQRHKHRGGLDGTVDLGDGVVGELLPAPQQRRALDLEQRPHVAQHTLGGLRESGPDGQVVQCAALRQRLDLIQEPGGHVVLMRKENGLRGALLAGAGVGVLVALPGDVVHVLHVGAQNLPVEARVLDLHLAGQLPREVLRGAAAPGELRGAHGGLLEQRLHDGPVAVDDVHVRRGHAAVVQQPHELLRHQRGGGRVLSQHLVAHVEGAHELQHGDLQGEVEGRDQPHRPERKAHPLRLLPRVVAWHREAPRQKTDLIAAEVLKKVAGHDHLPDCLLVALGDYSLNTPREEVHHLRLAHLLSGLKRNVSVHKVPLIVLEWVVQPSFRAGSETLLERLKLFEGRVGTLDELLPIHGIHDVEIFF